MELVFLFTHFTDRPLPDRKLTLRFAPGKTTGRAPDEAKPDEQLVVTSLW